MKILLRFLLCLSLSLTGLPGNAAADTAAGRPDAAALAAARAAFDAEFPNAAAKDLALHFTTKFPGGTAAFFSALSSVPAADRAGILSKLKNDVHGAMSEMVVHGGRTQSAPFAGSADALRAAGRTNEDLLAYYCPMLAGTSREQAARPQTLREGLERFNLASLSAVGAGGLEARRELANPLASNYDAAAARCSEFNRSRAPRPRGPAAFDPPPSGDRGGGSAAVVPEPGKGEDKAAAAAAPEKPMPWKKMAIGALGGAIGFGVIGFLLGGPAGLLLGAAAGALFMGGVTWGLNS